MTIRTKMAKIAAILSAAAIVATGCSGTTEGTVEQPPVVKVWKVTSAGSGLIARGKVTPAEEIQVVSKLPGKVARVHVKEGSVVKQGDLLVELEASEYLQQIQQAEAAIVSAQARLADARAGVRTQELQRLNSGVEQAQAALQVAEHTYNRMKALYDAGAISQAELERVTLELEKARTGYEQAKAQLDLAQAGPTANSLLALQAEVDRLQSSLNLAKNSYENTRVVAPISGMVARRSIDPGEMAQPGVPLLVLVKMDEVKVEASIPEDQINRLKVGSTLSVKVDSLGGKVLSGSVEFVSPVSDPNSSSFPIKIKLPNKDGSLRAGMLAEVYLSETGAAAAKWKLPASAVFIKDNKSYIYKVDGDVVHQVEVSVEERDKDWVTVTSGVSDSDAVVIHPDGNLREGSKVQIY
jgi:HlyD family secretion protein